jgi:hypothetical protein
MRLSRQNLAMAEQTLDAVASAISGQEIQADTHIALAAAYIALATAQHEQETRS